MTNGRMKLVTLAAIALLLVGLAGCSSDGDSEDAGGETTETTSTTEATDDGTFEPTDEQCAALDTVPEDQADLDARVALFPEDLQDDVQEYTESIIAYITSADPETGEPTAPEPAPSEELDAVLTTCASLAGDADG